MPALPPFAAALLAVAPPAPAKGGDCGRILDPRTVRPGAVVGEDDLVRLRDLGSSLAASTGDEPFSVSPDGRRAALQVHQAVPERNLYCVAIVVVDLTRHAAPSIVDTGDELIRYSVTARGRLDYPYGLARTITPRWSPDGTRVAYLKEMGGRIQAWEARTDGAGARKVTDLPEGVDDLRYADDGFALILVSRPDVPSRLAALASEGADGFHYDSRFAPMMRLTPFPPGPAPDALSAISLADGSMRQATGAERAQFARDAIAGLNQGTTTATSASGRVATLSPDPDGLLQRRQHLRFATGPRTFVECAAKTCGSDIVSHWWSPDGSRIMMLRREGPAGETSAFYSWRPGPDAPLRLSTTDDLLFGCTPVGRRVACARETSVRPRHLALIEPATGRGDVVFDPNAEFETLRLGRTERLRLKDAFGAPLFADLVLPVDYRPGTRYPLVVVQYESRGFLRGGTGDEYPIQVLAGRGMAVLSMNRPPVAAYAPAARTFVEADRENLRGFRFRRGVHSGVEVAIAQLVARGVVDGRRVGLTGLSEGASEVTWALIHDTRFAAAAMSGCCWGPQTMPLTGLAAASDYRVKGYPHWSDPAGAAFWNDLSLAVHAHDMRTPLLIQAADDELLDAIDAYTQLDAAGAPLELLSFPDEHHVKWQPAHRLAIYRRNVEWFAYWLQDGGSHPDLARWSELKGKTIPQGRRPDPDWTRPTVHPDQ